MIPRVGAALTKYVKPVSEARNETSFQVSHKDNQEFKRDKRGSKQKKDEKPKLSLVKTEPEAPPGEPTKEPAVSATVTPLPVRGNGGLESVSTFLSLYRMLQQKKEQLVRWLGLQTYETALKSQNKSGKIQQGTMLDREVE